MKKTVPMYSTNTCVHSKGAAIPLFQHQATPQNIPSFGFYPNQKATKGSVITLLEYLHQIKNGLLSLELIQQIRSTPDEKQQIALKSRLQCVTISGTFSGSKHNAALQQHSQLLNIDVDRKDNTDIFEKPERLKLLLEAVQTLPGYVAGWDSVRFGKSFLFKIKPDQHLEAFESLKIYFRKCGVTIDAACKNVARLRYASYDPELHYNELLNQDFNLVPYYLPVQKKKPAPAPKKQPAVDQAPEDEIVNYVLKIAEKNGHSFTPGKRHEFTVYVASLLNQFGVPEYTALAALQQELGNSENPEHHIKTLTDIYSRYKDQFGKLSYEKIEKKPAEKTGKKSGLKVDTLVCKEETYTGQSVYLNRYLSEVQLPEHKHLIVNAPTNCGKTSYFAKVATGKRILLVPTVPLALQVQKQYGVKAVYEGVTVSKYDEVLVGTYESLQKMLSVLNVGAFQLWVDEAHNLVQATSLGYRNKSLREVSESFEYFDRVVLLSGTWIDTAAEPLKDFELINVISRDKKPGKFVVVPTENRLHSIASRIKQQPESLHVVYLNARMKAETTAKTLSELGTGRFIAIHSKNKHEPEQKQIIEKGLLPAGVQGIVITDVFKEGLSLLNDKPFQVHLFSMADSITTEQVINRVRNVQPVTYCYINPDREYSTEEMTKRQRLEFETELKERATKAAAALEQLRELTFNLPLINAWNMIRTDKRRESLFLDKYSRQLLIMPETNATSVKINHFGIANSAYQRWCDIERSNPQMYLANIKSYGYSVEILKAETETNQELTENHQSNGKELKELEQQQISEVLSEFEAEGIEYVQEIDRVQLAPPLKLELAAKWIWLFKRLADPAEIPQILTKNYTTKAWNRYRTQLENQIYITYQLDKKRSTNRLIRLYMASFEANKTYTADQVFTITKDILSRFESHKAAAETLTKTKATQDLKLFFTVKTGSKKDKSHRIIKAGALDIAVQEPVKKAAMVTA